GVLAASLVGVAPLATLLAFAGALAGFAHDLTSTLLILVAIVVNLLLCVVASRTLVAVLVPILRSRRGRDFTILAVTILGLLPPDRIGATAAKDLRYSTRDPRRRAPLIAALVLPAVALWAPLSQIPDRPGSATLLALIAVLPAAGLTLNQFGLDGAALWMTVA